MNPAAETGGSRGRAAAAVAAAEAATIAASAGVASAVGTEAPSAAEPEATVAHGATAKTAGRTIPDTGAEAVKGANGSNDPPRRLLWPAVPIPGESLMGLVAAAAADNFHEISWHILSDAGAPHARCFNLATHEDIDPARLADILRIDLDEVVSRMHPQVARHGNESWIDFYGASIPRDDLRFRRRRVAPAALRRSTHHRALACHALLPFCNETGALLIDTCPACGGRLGWYHTRGVEMCGNPIADGKGHCEFDLRSAPDAFLDDATLREVRQVANLLYPDPALHGEALSALHADLQTMDRGLVFELVWRLGCIAQTGALELRRYHKSLDNSEILSRLSAGARIVRDWPVGCDRLFADAVKTGDLDKANRYADAMHRLVRSQNGLPEHAQLLRRTHPHLLRHKRRTISSFDVDFMDSRQAARHLGIDASFFERLTSGSIVPIAHGGGGAGWCIFSRAALEPIRLLLSDRISARAAAERLGITFHGVEQLVCLKLLDRLDHPAIDSGYDGLQLSEKRFDSFRRAMEKAGSDDLGEKVRTIGLRAVMRAFPSEKPWGPVLRLLADGRVPFVTKAGGGRLVDRIAVRHEDIGILTAVAFGEQDFPDFQFASRMTRRDAQDVLNLNARDMLPALSGALRPASLDGTWLDRQKVRTLAALWMSGGEIFTRSFDRQTKAYLAFQPLRDLPREELGWLRKDAEDLLRRHGLLEDDAETCRLVDPDVVGIAGFWEAR